MFHLMLDILRLYTLSSLAKCFTSYAIGHTDPRSNQSILDLEVRETGSLCDVMMGGCNKLGQCISVSVGAICCAWLSCVTPLG